MHKNEKYSHQDFTGRSLKDVDPAELSGTVIVGSCFYQEWQPGALSPRCDIFPDGMTGVVFLRCNLDNVVVPPGNFVETKPPDACSQRRIRVQNDGEDWILDKNDKPVEPVHAAILRKQGKPMPKPEDLPAKPLTAAEIEGRREAERLEAEIVHQQEELAAKQARLDRLKDKVN